MKMDFIAVDYIQRLKKKGLKFLKVMGVNVNSRACINKKHSFK
jgi:hypothetical protein